MNTMKLSRYKRALLLAFVLAAMITASTRTQATTGTCGGSTITLPFTDVPNTNVFFCSIAEAFFVGLTNGTTATTFSPGDPVAREQMAAFVTRTMDQSVKRRSKRAALNQFWVNQGGNSLALTTVGSTPIGLKSDGQDIWVATNTSGVTRVRASDGRVLGTWTGVNGGVAVLVAIGKVFILAGRNPGVLYQIDPAFVPGTATILTSSLGDNSLAIAFDGHRIWTANVGNGGSGIGSVSIVTLDPLTVTNVTTGFGRPEGIVYDGANMWISDGADNQLKKLDSSGNIMMSVPVGMQPGRLTFDGTNIWVANFLSNSISVVRATGPLSGTVLATLTGNGLNEPIEAAFDGERMLVTNFGDSVSLWKASDLTPIGTFPTSAGTHPYGVCSDGLNFWIALLGSDKIARF